MADDAELRRRLEVLRQKMEDGKIVIAEHLREDFQQSFGAVKAGSDGEIDLTTVDGRVRSMAMAVAMMEDRENTKSAASLAEVQDAYFQRVTSMFGEVHKMMCDENTHPQALSWALSRDAEHVEKNYPLIEPFVSELEEFWSVVSEPVRYHLQDIDALKGVFGGDLFPTYERNIASTTGLYLDTIVLTDPFMNTKEPFSLWPNDEAVRMFLKHGLQVMNYRSLALASLEKPIVAFLPFDSSFDEGYRESLFSASATLALQHAEQIFEQPFATVEQLTDFLKPLETPNDIAGTIANVDRLLFDCDWEGDANAQVGRAIDEFHHLAGKHAGGVVFNQCFGRMSQATDISWKSKSLGGVPLIEAPTSWQYYNWMLEYSAAKNPDDLVSLHTSRGVQSLSETEMQWLGNIPPGALIEIRKEGALDEIRAMLSEGVEEVANLKPDNFFRSADKVYDNIEKAFADHQAKIDELKLKKWKFAGSDIGSWVVAGTVEVASAVLGAPALGLASIAISQLTDAPKLKDIPKMATDIKRESDELSKSAFGLLFKHKD